MSYRILQLSPQASTRFGSRRNTVRGPWNERSTPALDLGFVDSWFERDSDLDGSFGGRQTNWGAISGLALSVAASACFWAGVAWMIGRVWR
jgi:hypothetical protein